MLNLLTKTIIFVAMRLKMQDRKSLPFQAERNQKLILYCQTSENIVNQQVKLHLDGNLHDQFIPQFIDSSVHIAYCCSIELICIFVPAVLRQETQRSHEQLLQ